ncbi:MAG: hypothetical protein U0X92_01730 [Anaerolineales bacterium]
MSEKSQTSRAEQVRLRREQERAKELARAMKQATRPVPSVPRPKPEAAKKVAPAKQKERRFQIALAMPRFNLRAIHMPQIPRPRLGWRAPLVLSPRVVRRGDLSRVQPARVARDRGASERQPHPHLRRDQFGDRRFGTAHLLADSFGIGNTTPTQLP